MSLMRSEERWPTYLPRSALVASPDWSTVTLTRGAYCATVKRRAAGLAAVGAYVVKNDERRLALPDWAQYLVMIETDESPKMLRQVLFDLVWKRLGADEDFRRATDTLYRVDRDDLVYFLLGRGA